MANSSFDLIVVGGGPGGYVAAIRATQLGMKTALVEKEHLGGVCLNWGCIPTKALLRSADVLRLVRNAASFGVRAAAPTADLPAMVARSRAVAAQLNKGVVHLMKKHGVTVLNGHGRLAGKGKLDVTAPDGKTSTVSSAHILLATGARARQLPALPADGKTVWTYREALAPPVVPKRMLIVGAGAIGIEFASFYQAVGVEVTVIEMADRILPASCQRRMPTSPRRWPTACVGKASCCIRLPASGARNARRPAGPSSCEAASPAARRSRPMSCWWRQVSSATWKTSAWRRPPSGSRRRIS
ncbi:dihydrolipoamide dehydrogenase [Cupriavidus basilensis OR16]|uniref:Dihydrolipoamide dehydrogenase n=1 Tax=Cupriavidus basilensis OR16 TaxID=1127483 RepID=H1S2I5_9BURK|nr:dihydrolipoamide dehydrogenase [Cupriavidus basilensis OR16]